jgi:16S rRNA (uracil1498-N3)-methyltransferase
MPIERYFVEDPLLVNTEVMISKDEHLHMTKVMRAKTKDPLELINGKGSLAKAYISEIKKDHSLCVILSVEHTPPPPSLILAQAIPRFNRLEYIIEKGTELNVSEFWLFPGDRSEKNLFSPNQKERMKHLMIAAAKQCGRLHLPEIHIKESLHNWSEMEAPLLFGDTREKAPFLLDIGKSKEWHSCIMAIGPESGFSDKEVVHLESLKGRGVKLHSNILRVDTASLTALSLVSYLLK